MVLNLGLHIANLLREHNRVSLPDFGAFVGTYKPAILNEETLELAPPHKEITFSKDETWNDELLENLISKVEEVSIAKAKKAVAKAVAEIVAELQENGTYAFPGFGQLVKKGWSISFRIEEGVNLLAEAFGLETIGLPNRTIPQEKKKMETPKAASSAPIQPQSTKPASVAAPTAASKLPHNSGKPKSKIGWVLLGLFAVIAALVGYLYYDDFFTTKADSIQPVTANSSTEPLDTTLTENYTDTIDSDTTINKVVAEEIDNQTEKRKALYYEEPKSASDGVKTFYIIAGSFNRMENAEKLQKMLVKEGFKPEILTVDGPIFRVSMYSFTNRNRALQELARLRDQNKERSIWLLGL